MTMLLSETSLMKHLLTKGYVVSSKRLAREFGTSVYEVAGTLKMLRTKGVVKHLRARKWQVDRDKLLEEINAGSTRKLVVINGRLLNMKCEMCYNEDYWSEVVDGRGKVLNETVECHQCGHKQKRK